MMNINFFQTVRKSDRTDALAKIIEGGYPRRELFLVTALASGIAAIGLLQDDLVLIIGSMIVAPLLMPLLALGVSLTLRDGHLLFTSLRTIFFGSLVSILFVVPLSLLLDNQEHTNSSSYFMSIEPSVESAVVAVLAGVISAFAISKEKLSSSMAGVAISVALIPPLAGIGIAIADEISYINNSGLSQIMQQYLLNVAAIAVSSAAVFTYLDYGDSLKQAEKKLKKEESDTKKEQEISNNGK